MSPSQRDETSEKEQGRRVSSLEFSQESKRTTAHDGTSSAPNRTEDRAKARRSQAGSAQSKSVAETTFPSRLDRLFNRNHVSYNSIEVNP
jgi:hypothetical protein